MLRLDRKATQTLRAELQTLDAGNPASVFAALADPLRIKIVMLMRGQKDLCVTDIAELLGASLPLISHHLRILKEAGVVTVKRDGQMQCYFLAYPNIGKIVETLRTMKRR